MPLFLLFLGVPLIEIALFIQVGGWIGLWPTLLIVVLTAIAGTMMVKAQGRLALSQVQQTFDRLENPTEPLAHGAMILFSGALLLTPGFFTDAVGFALLFPPVRRWAYRTIRDRVKVQSFTMGQRPRQPGPAPDDVIDGDYTEIDPPTKAPTHGNSGWTRH